MSSVLMEEAVEKNMDKLDCRPGLSFVQNNLHHFKRGLSIFLERPISSYVDERNKQIQIKNISKAPFVGITPQQTSIILSRIPEILWKLSDLCCVDYQYADLVPIPTFDEDGYFYKCEDLITEEQFIKENRSPRILIGHNDGTNINYTCIPKIYWPSSESIYYYQIYVLLHKFFHTVETPKRVNSKNCRQRKVLRRKIILRNDSIVFSFQNWWSSFEKVLLAKKEKAASDYSENYDQHVSFIKRKHDNTNFTLALAENMADTFAAYCLGILPNQFGYTDFRFASLGNERMNNRFKFGISPSANMKWLLMDKLCNSQLITK